MYDNLGGSSTNLLGQQAYPRGRRSEVFHRKTTTYEVLIVIFS